MSNNRKWLSKQGCKSLDKIPHHLNRGLRSDTETDLQYRSVFKSLAFIFKNCSLSLGNLVLQSKSWDLSHQVSLMANSLLASTCRGPRGLKARWGKGGTALYVGFRFVGYPTALIDVSILPLPLEAFLCTLPRGLSPHSASPSSPSFLVLTTPTFLGSASSEGCGVVTTSLPGFISGFS